jgi:protoporphyrinogen oxidase
MAVIGGGIIGVTLAYKLSQAGHEVTVSERSDELGGLAGYIPYDGVRLDRFYHTILSSDMSMQTLIRECDIADRLHFTATKQGFYDEGKLHSFTTPVDFALFKPLNPFQRFRLGLQIVAAQLGGDERQLNDIPVKDWLVRVSGRGVYEKVWRPLLRAKFDSMETDVPATYIWSRLRRMMGTRQGVTSKEMMCYLENSYYTLIEAMAANCEERGVTIHLETAVDEVVVQNGRAAGIRAAGSFQPFDAIISTLQSPLLGRLMPDAPESFRRRLLGQEYLGVVCPLLILKRPLTPYYVLNITDDSIPFTAVVETTNLVDPAHVKGHHLVYLPKFLAPGSELLEWSDERVEAEWLKHLKRMFPEFDEADITDFVVQRARYVEPLHPLGAANQTPPVKTPVQRLYMANTAMVYPELNNGESGTRLAGSVAETILADAQTYADVEVAMQR